MTSAHICSPHDPVSQNLAMIRNALLAVIPFEEFGSLNDVFDYYRDHGEKSVKLITTARPFQE
jgi:hypothetical protein